MAHTVLVFAIDSLEGSVLSKELNAEEVAQILEDFLEGRGDPLRWDDFTLGMSFTDRNFESIRVRCLGLSSEFPPESPREYCNARGREVIREYVSCLRRDHRRF